MLQVAAAAAAWGFPFIILGDFNVLQAAPSMIGVLSSPGLHSMDDAFGPVQLLPPTRKASSRRIDYGVCSGNLFPQRLMHFAGVADHLLVAYGFDCLDILQCPRPPKRMPLDLSREADVVANRFLQVWDEHTFMMLLGKAEIDSALQVLSSSAEFALQQVGMDSCVCAPRSQSWFQISPTV